MLELSKINQRKTNTDLGYTPPSKNLDRLKNSINSIYSLESYVTEWRSYDINEQKSLDNVLSIIESFLEKNNKDYMINNVERMIESYIIPKITNKNCINTINEFALDNNLQSMKFLAKLNEMFTYDRILRNQNILEKKISIYKDFTDTVLEICNLYDESNLSTEEKFALSLENSLYTYDTSIGKYYIFNSRDEVIDTVEMYYGLSYNEAFDYSLINVINEINAFGGAIVAGTITGVYLNNVLPLETMLSKMPKHQLKEYESDNGLKPLREIDFDRSKMISTLMTNDYSSADRKEVRDMDINGKTYKAIAFYEGSALSKVSLLYTKGKSVVAVPIYAKITDCQPTMVSYGIVKNLHETSMYDITFMEAKKIQNVKKKTEKKLKSILKDIYTKSSKNADVCVKNIKKTLSTFFANDERHIIDEIPSVFDVVRVACALGSLAINPYLAIIVYMTGLLMKIHFEKEKGEKVLKKYDNEIEKIEKKIKECKNEKTKENYKKYLKELKDSRGKLYDHYDKYMVDQDDEDDFSFDESYIEPVNELSLVNNLKLSQQNLKKNLQKLSDTEKKFSARMDNAYDRFVYQIEKNMSNKNREAVIKGSVIPSFSALIKLAIASGAASFVSPVLSAITVMGGLAASKKATANERKYILDEIEVQLKVVDKKLQLAEGNNDMKSYEQLLKIQRQLESEKNRIIYKKRRPVVATKYN